MREQAVIGRQQIPEVVFTGDTGQGNTRATGVPAQVEGQAHAAQAGDALGPLQVPLLATAPAMHEQHAGHPGFWGEEGRAHAFAVDLDVNGFTFGRHRV
ncbi:hypothetical protein D3C81_2016040 [compost metagenome]